MINEMSKMERFIIYPQDTILRALQKININKKRFLIVVNEENVVLGTLSDGDIRRGFINGKSVEDNVDDIYTKKYKYVKNDSAIEEAIEIFRDERIEFLPIVDGEQKIKSVITKKQLYGLLLQDTRIDLEQDFIKMDENTIEHDISPRAWGFYKTTVINDYFQSKIISVKPKSQLSLQSHTYREEIWIVVHGSGQVQIADSIMQANCGSTFFIPKGCKHRLINNDEKENLIITEVQLGDYFGEEDIIRYEDIYGRV